MPKAEYVFCNVAQAPTVFLFFYFQVPIVCHPLCTEQVTGSDDIGHPPHVIEERYPNIDWSELKALGKEVWWHSGPSVKVGIHVLTYQAPTLIITFIALPLSLPFLHNPFCTRA